MCLALNTEWVKLIIFKNNVLAAWVKCKMDYVPNELKAILHGPFTLSENIQIN